jgi:cytochrome c-type biogenesis protein CcmH
MKTKFKTVILLLLFTTSPVLHSADVIFTFEDPVQEQRYRELIDELRCLVCQNQSLADSHAELAQDLRNEVFAMIIQGDSDDTIIAFLVDRYGDFVLYRPPLKFTTWLLWFGPLLGLMIALFAASRIIGNRARGNGDLAELSDEQRQKLADILDKPDETGSREEK